MALCAVYGDNSWLKSIDYVYDPTTKELTDIVSDQAGTFSFGTDPFGRRQTLSYPNGIVGSYSYDDTNQLDWLTGITYTDSDSSSNILNIGYPEHDKVGNRTQRAEDGTVTTYSYDDLYRVTSAQTGPSVENFTYDDVGNRESGPTVKDTPEVSYDHNSANQMTKGRKFTYQYDNRGNQIYRIMNSTGTKYWYYSWNASNQLTQADLVFDGTTIRTVSFKYDAFGRRIEKRVEGQAPVVPVPLTTTYLYDGEDIILELISDGTTTTTRQYLHGPGIDEPLAQIVDGQSYYYHADGLGSVLALTDSSKGIVQRYTYDTFGMLTSIQNPEFGNSYTYTAREWDRELGLYYYRARYYDPMEGRFISKDPIGFAGGDVNVYGYVWNNPLNWLDPYGLDGVGANGWSDAFLGGSYNDAVSNALSGAYRQNEWLNERAQDELEKGRECSEEARTCEKLEEFAGNALPPSVDYLSLASACISYYFNLKKENKRWKRDFHYREYNKYKDRVDSTAPYMGP